MRLITQFLRFFRVERVNIFPLKDWNQSIHFLCFYSAHITPLIVVSFSTPPRPFRHPSPIREPPRHLLILHKSIHLFASLHWNEMQVTHTFSLPAVAVLVGAATKCVPVRSKSDWLTARCCGRSPETPPPPHTSYSSLPLQYPSPLLASRCIRAGCRAVGCGNW